MAWYWLLAHTAADAAVFFLGVPAYTGRFLEQLYQRAQLNAYQRFSGDIRCRDIMSQDLITVRADTPLFMAWQLLRKHKIGSLPVVDADQRLIGIIATVDILKQLHVPSYAALFQHQLRQLQTT